MIYKVLRQCSYDERSFDLEDEKGEQFRVDIYTSGELNPPAEVLDDNAKFAEWLKSFVGKKLEINRIYPYAYFTSGEIKVYE